MRYTYKVVYREKNMPPEKVTFVQASNEGEVRYIMFNQYRDAFIVSIKKQD